MGDELASILLKTLCHKFLRPLKETVLLKSLLKCPSGFLNQEKDAMRKMVSIWNQI